MIFVALLQKLCPSNSYWPCNRCERWLYERNANEIRMPLWGRRVRGGYRRRLVLVEQSLQVISRDVTYCHVTLYIQSVTQSHGRMLSCCKNVFNKVIYLQICINVHSFINLGTLRDLEANEYLIILCCLYIRSLGNSKSIYAKEKTTGKFKWEIGF